MPLNTCLRLTLSSLPTGRVEPAAGREGVVQESRVGDGQVHIELGDAERTGESISLELESLRDRVARVEDGHVERGREEVSGGEIRGGITTDLVRWKRPGFLDLVIALLVGDGRPEIGPAQAGLAEPAPSTRRRVCAHSSLLLVPHPD